MPDKRIRVLIVDVSASMRLLISHILSADSEIEVVESIPDILLARDGIASMHLDVICFNAAMAGRESTAALGDIVRSHRIAVVVLGSRTHPEWSSRYATFDPRYVHYLALAGASAYGTDPETSVIVACVKAAARRARGDRPRATADAAHGLRPVAAAGRMPRIGASRREVIAIGASTGGTQAIAEVLKCFPADAPGTVIVQHMPPGFTSTFAKHLNNAVEIEVKEAADGDEVRQGRALIAPAGHHMELVRRNGQLHASIIDTDPVNRHRPSVDVLFDSVAQVVGRSVVGAILTGMGNDGAAGMFRMHERGALTVAQDEASCVVFGMPREAIKLHGVDSVLPIDRIGRELIAMARR